VNSQELSRSEIDRLGDIWERAWVGGQREDLALCCTVDVQYEDPLSAGVVTGVDALSEHVTRLRIAFPDLRIESSGPRIGEGNHGALPWRLIGTQRGPLGEIPATKKFMTLQGMHYVELRDGLIARGRGFFDLYDAAMQLGLLPKRGSLGESALLMLRGFGLRARP
jgi:steroid delta-isomerase-like uncharacterized protein